MFIILLSQIGGAIAIYVLKGDAREVITTKMKEGMQHYDEEGYQGVTDSWNQIQNELKCCGVNNYTDWKNTNFSQGTDVPDDCCIASQKGKKKELSFQVILDYWRTYVNLYKFESISLCILIKIRNNQKLFTTES